MIDARKTIYILTGPLGVGKSSVAQEITRLLPNSTYIEGDVFFLQLEKENVTWDQRLEISLSKIVEAIHKHLPTSDYIVVDFAADVGPSWFVKNVGNLGALVKYCVLIADPETIAERLEKRGEVQYLERSLKLLNNLKKDESNNLFLLENSHKQIPEIAEEIIANEAFVIRV